MGAGIFENKHGVGIFLNKRWKKKIIETEYISESLTSTTTIVNQQNIMLMSAYFPHSGYADHHNERMYKTIEKHTESKRTIQIIGGDFSAELGSGDNTERNSVGQYTLKESNKRGGWMKQWLMMQGLVALNTMYEKKFENQSTFRSPKGNEKQIDVILTNRKHLKMCEDAEANTT